MATVSIGLFPPRFTLALSPRVGLSGQFDGDALRMQSANRSALIQWRPGMRLTRAEREADKARGGGLRTFGPLFIATGPTLDRPWM